MKERQQRQSGLITPQMGSGSQLPMVSPQPAPQNLNGQQQQQFRQTPQNIPTQLPQQEQQQSRVGQGQGQPEDSQKKSMASIMRDWSDDQLRMHTAQVSKKMANAVSP